MTLTSRNIPVKGFRVGLRTGPFNLSLEVVKRMANNKKDLANGLGSDKIYENRLTTEMPVLMFPRDEHGQVIETITAADIQKQFNLIKRT